jgi:hypothetical protein
MVYFQSKNLNLGNFWRALDWKMLIKFMTLWNILRTFDIFCDHLLHFVTFRVHLVHFILFWFYVPRKIWQPCFWDNEYIH